MEIRPDPHTVRWLETIGESPELGAAYLVESAETLWRSLLDDAARRLQLTVAEANAILDATNGLQLLPGFAGAHLELEVRDADRLSGLGEKWGVDPDFLDRLSLLSRGERWAVEVWAAAGWVTGDSERYPGGRYNDPEWTAQHLSLLVRREERTEPRGVTGKPPRDESALSDTPVTIRVTASERDRIRELAEKAGLSVSEYVRRMVL